MTSQPSAPAGQNSRHVATPTESSRAGGRLRLAMTVLLSIVAPLVILNVAKAQDVPDVQAYILASLPPLLEAVITAFWRRTVDTFAVIIVALNLGSAALALVGDTSPTMLLLKDSALTGAFGLICLITLLPIVPRPLMFYFGQRFGGGGTAEGEQRFADLWQHPQFRRLMRIITAMWGVGFVLEAAIKVVVAETYSFQAAFNLNQVLPLVVTALLVVATIALGRWGKKQGDKARARRLSEEAGRPAVAERVS